MDTDTDIESISSWSSESELSSSDKDSGRSFALPLVAGFNLVMACIFVAHLVVAAILPFVLGGFKICSTVGVFEYWTLIFAGAIPTGLATLFLIARAVTHHVQFAALYAASLWFMAVTIWGTQVVSCWFPYVKATPGAYVLQWQAEVLATLSTVFFFRMVLSRLRTLEEAMWEDVGSRTLSSMFYVYCFFCSLSCVIDLGVYWTSREAHEGWLHPSTSRFPWNILMTLLCVIAFCVKAFLMLERPCARVLQAWPNMSTDQRDAATRATCIVLSQQAALVLSVWSKLVRAILWILYNRLASEFPWVPDAIEGLTLVDFISESVGAIMFSGAYGMKSLKHSLSRRLMEQQRSSLRRQVATHWRPSERDSPMWQVKVAEMAKRGISLKALLDFYERLGQTVMPEYKSDLHRTKDVVRAAIIPETKDRCCSMATVMMSGIPTRPDKFVSHSWGNLFHDLVASIVADALGEVSYEACSFLLASNFRGLKAALSAKDCLNTTYWICAFAVNQHATICETNPYDFDPSTGRLYKPCKCKSERHLNTTPPLTLSGKSIWCEVNKFKDMLRYLAACNEQLEHVIAVDANFDLFTRAWVVAELAEAHDVGIRQHLRIKSRTTLLESEHSLRDLRIEAMQASRPEDIDEILAGIQDKDAFNSRLQSMIFGSSGGLISEWKGLDGLEQMTRIGQLARFANLSHS
eukprot:TRINITY_DN3503_c0_g1_i1.p1 TRINITY_DN3503_c0_g1~~TRINITY_DN3503_c0_g1_i1.p1  ORF type:complete len:692 (-),score=79.06 TRINITY_DN3503_c0_g1_i1:291-2366(-)